MKYDAVSMRNAAERRTIAGLQPTPARQPALVPINEISIKAIAGQTKCPVCGKPLAPGRAWGVGLRGGGPVWCDECTAERSPEALAVLRMIEG